ncbi:acetylornithine transaminase [Herbaspirillum sp. BH-1]|uniref:Acetylornithine aminotransferase n=2 Tax=Herbaspirillum frisingense TaxID=92645 RepID=A0AAI9IFU5_9BURK|nr:MULTISPECIES: acetylornithine transaminase [Herbaspirillum]EOA05341.1 acetylornithine transaminase protein [Herbaspirillum frisingense GSF30]MDR6583693.1 acetylornithine/N-succinyldiaminopimelate aminotransferase [Herbaspirillum frisingense]ONN63836.1 acetylornithine transaminase [Herbaspirillum sp. VT-16-41]PLY58706.1 acetylornithine transaminase [Herbaspirillum sp. BH-1]QNB08520.1 acetylornithine transaminase [Herbaspirillum frisingense]
MQYSQSDANKLMYVTNRPELVFTEGQGMWLTDHNGKRYLDYLQGWAVNTLGHAPQCIADALAAQSKKLINPSPAFYNQPSIELAKLLTENSVFDRVFFANSGGEANEGAIKLARKWGKKNPAANGSARFEIITFKHSFHGRTLATMSASGKDGWDTMFAPQVPGFPKAILNDLDSVKALIGEHTVAVMLEPVQGEGGVIPATKEFMQGLRALTKEKNLLLIVDEVQSGMGRTGQLFAYQHSGIEPDIMTLAKGIGGGVPLAALLAREEIACFEAGEQGGTYNGNPLMTAVGVAVIKELLKPGFMEGVRERGQYLRQRSLEISEKYGFEGERGEGLLRALQLGRDIGPQIVEAARNLEPVGLLLNSPRPNLLRFMPALNVTKEEIDQMFDMLEVVLAKIGK